MKTEDVRRGLFVDEAHEDLLFKNGFVTIPMFKPDELKKLRDYYFNVHPESKVDLQGTLNGIHMTTWSGNTGYKRMVSSFLNHLFEDAGSSIFKNHRLLNHVFIAKEPGETTEFNIHQDWSVVDESKEFSVNIWVPLQDVSKVNGALWILPGSHKIDQPVRGAGCLFPDYMSDMSVLREQVKCIDLKAGEALIFFHSTIHGSPPNNGSQKRVVACCTAIHREAELRAYFQPSETAQLEVYNPDDDFMYNYADIMNESAFKTPQGKLVEKRPSYRLREINIAQFLAMGNPA